MPNEKLRKAQTQVLEAAQAALRQYDSEEEQEGLRLLLNRAGHGGLAVVGVQDSVAAINTGRVHKLSTRGSGSSSPGPDEENRMSIGKVCVRTVITAKPEESVTAVAKRMRQYDVGALVILEGRRPVGILTDRDLVIRVLSLERSPEETEVSAVMTKKLVCASEQTPLEDAMNLMRGYQIRRLIVVNAAGELAGIFTLDDMLELLGEEQAAVAGLMRAVRGRNV